MNNNPLKISMKTILLAVMGTLLIFAVITNANQANDIEVLNNRINNLTSELNLTRNDIRSIYDNVEEKLKKQASLLSHVEYSFENLNTDNHTVDMEITVVPKSIVNDIILSIMVGDTVADFTKNGNEFSAVIPVNLFLDYGKYPMLYLETNGGTQTEVLEDVRIDDLYERYLPNLQVHIPSNADFISGKMELNSDLRISVKPSMYETAVTFVEYELVIEVNGKETEREDLTAKVTNGNYDGQIRKSIDAKLGDYVLIYLLAEDSLGYVHKAMAMTWYQNENDALAEVPMYDGDCIYDKDGVLLRER